MPNANTSKSVTRAGLGLAAAAMAAFALSGCGAGQVTQTDSMVPAVPGTNATITKAEEGIDIAMRDVYVEFYHCGYAKGGSAPISARLFNNGTSTDELTKVESSAADEVNIATGGVETSQEDDCEAAQEPSDEASASESPSGEESPSGDQAPSQDASPSESGSQTTPPADGAGQAAMPLDLPVGGKQLLHSGADQHLELTGLTQKLGGGDIITITFFFKEAGKKEIEIPVAPPEEPVDRETPADHGDHH